MQVTPWGRLSAMPHKILRLSTPESVDGQLKQPTPVIARGMGRSYGDVALQPAGVVLDMRGLDHLVSLDRDRGVLIVEAGATLTSIQSVIVPQGWSLPVLPGTGFVTVGGAIACDVHGKNHHVAGSFGNHIRAIELARSDTGRLWCSREVGARLFHATIGGLGLTGVVVRAELSLVPTAGPWVEAQNIAFAGVGEFLALSAESAEGFEHTVAWVDCVGSRAGRGIFERGRGIESSGSPAPAYRRSVTWTPPVSLVNSLTLRPFNSLYYGIKSRRRGLRKISTTTFLHPLDAVSGWNRLYGPRGFYQYQCVIPPVHQLDGINALLREVARSGAGSMLAVLKTFGDRAAEGVISFPRVGTTLALDFPNRGSGLLRLFERLDAIVAEAGGAIYPAKDARMSSAMFQSGFPRWRELLALRDPAMGSMFARRVLDVGA